jgi:L-asparaginase II
MTSQQLSGNSKTKLATGAVSLVEVTRGPLVESRHHGHIVAVEPDGRMVASAGDPETITYMRSAAKLHQAIPLVASGAADRFRFTEKEIALACASHSGEAIHTEIAASMLRKIQLPQDALKCGTHEPFSAEVARQLRERGEQPTVLQNNCSGKHAGMLALALHLGAPPETYDQSDNPVQVMIKRCVSHFSDVPLEEIVVGIDGCGVPVFGVRLSAMALMCARLVATPNYFDGDTIDACGKIVAAVMAHPELIGGSSDRLDTELMRAAKGRLISKVGAEGVYTVGVLPCKDWPKGLGLALKIEDGDDHRARPTVVIEALRQLGVLRGESLAAVERYRSFTVRNRRGDRVGEVKASFALRHIEQ